MRTTPHCCEVVKEYTGLQPASGVDDSLENAAAQTAGARVVAKASAAAEGCAATAKARSAAPRPTTGNRIQFVLRNSAHVNPF